MEGGGELSLQITFKITILRYFDGAESGLRGRGLSGKLFVTTI